MGKKIIFNVILNLLILCSVVIAFYAYDKGNYFVPILCAASFGLSLYYKIRLMKEVRREMRDAREKQTKSQKKKHK